MHTVQPFNYKLYKMQKRAAREITVSSYEKRYREIFERLSWEPIENILKKREITMTFKAVPFLTIYLGRGAIAPLEK